MKIERIGDVITGCVKPYYVIGRALPCAVSRSQVRDGGWEQSGCEHKRMDMISCKAMPCNVLKIGVVDGNKVDENIVNEIIVDGRT